MLPINMVTIALEGGEGFAFAAAVVSRFFCTAFQVGDIGENAQSCPYF